MDFVSIFRTLFALAIVVGLILAASVVLRRYGPQLLTKLQYSRGEKRMEIIESLVLDPARRLVLVRLDDEERLILLGEGSEMIEPRQLKARPLRQPVMAPVMTPRSTTPPTKV